MYTKTVTFLLFSLLLCVYGCGDSSTEEIETMSNGGTTGEDGIGGSNGGGGDTGGSGTIVTIGVFSYDDSNGTYTDLNKDFVFEVGKSCQTWSRRVAMPNSRDEIQEAHDHFNAADEVVYENGSVGWTEYGPLHTQADIDALCASKTDGKRKEGITADEYYDDGNMGLSFYLKIKGVESN